MKKNLIIGAACGYGRAELENFVVSCKHSSPSADVLLLIEENAPIELIQFLEETETCYHIIFVARSKSSLRFYRAVGVTLWGGLWARMDENKFPLFERIVLSTIKVACARYYLYRNIIEKHENVERILICDTRDVVLTGDPFAHLTDNQNERLCVAIENRDYPLQRESNTRGWVAGLYGDSAVEAIGECGTSCSGTTLGTRTAILDYLGRMTQEMKRLRRKITRGVGWDQGIHNYLLWNEKLRYVYLCENQQDFIATVGLEAEDSITFTPKDLSASWNNGTKIDILHQYDRHQHLGEQVDLAIQQLK